MSFTFKKKVAAKQKIESRAQELFRFLLSAPPSCPLMGRMMGSPKARILFVAPPPTVEEFEHNMPLTRPAGQLLIGLFQEAGFDIQERALVISCSRFGVPKKGGNFTANKASTSPIKDFITKCGAEKLFDFYVCIGDEAFKFIFGEGKKPSSATLIGNAIHVPETGYKPLVFMPEIDPLIYVEGPDDRENWRRRRIADELAESFTTLAERLQEQLRHYGVK